MDTVLLAQVGNHPLVQASAVTERDASRPRQPIGGHLPLVSPSTHAHGRSLSSPAACVDARTLPSTAPDFQESLPCNVTRDARGARGPGTPPPPRAKDPYPLHRDCSPGPLSGCAPEWRRNRSRRPDAGQRDAGSAADEAPRRGTVGLTSRQSVDQRSRSAQPRHDVSPPGVCGDGVSTPQIESILHRPGPGVDLTTAQPGARVPASRCARAPASTRPQGGFTEPSRDMLPPRPWWADRVKWNVVAGCPDDGDVDLDHRTFHQAPNTLHLIDKARTQRPRPCSPPSSNRGGASVGWPDTAPGIRGAARRARRDPRGTTKHHSTLRTVDLGDPGNPGGTAGAMGRAQRMGGLDDRPPPARHRLIQAHPATRRLTETRSRSSFSPP